MSEYNFDALDAADEAVQAATEQQKRIYAQWAEANSPVRPSDVVEWNGYSHSGERVLVRHATPCRFWGGERGMKILGMVLKKDGSASASDVSQEFAFHKLPTVVDRVEAAR